MEKKKLLKLKNHILSHEDQKLIDKFFGKNRFRDVVLDIIIQEKLFGIYIFIGEVLIKVLETEKLIEKDFEGGFNEGEHYLVIDIPEDVEKFKIDLFEEKEKRKETGNSTKDVVEFLKEEYQNNKEVIQKVKELVEYKKHVRRDKKAIYKLMNEALTYVGSRKMLSELFGVGINYYKNLEKELEEDK